MTEPDLTTRYLGLELPSPLVASASPLTARPEEWEHLERAGAGALVLPSLFEEQLTEADRAIDGTDHLPFLAEADGYNAGAERYLGMVEDARARVSVPIVASLNGTTLGGWARYAHLCEQAGAHAIELNAYAVAADLDEDATTVEARYVELVEAVVASVGVPVAVKLAPYFSSLGHLAHRLVDAGAAGLVLFNRFTRLDVDLDAGELHLPVDLSTPDALGLPLRWTGMLAGEIDASLAVSGGVHAGTDAVKAILVGADVAMTTSALLRDGPGGLERIRRQLVRWLDERGERSVGAVRGRLSRRHVSRPEVYGRASYLHALARAASAHGLA